MPKKQSDKKRDKKKDYKKEKEIKKQKPVSKISEQKQKILDKKEQAEIEHMNLWIKVKRLGNEPGLTRDSSTQQMKNYVTDLDLETIRHKEFFNGLVTTDVYEIKNKPYARKYNLLRMINSFGVEQNPKFSIAVETADGRQQYRQLDRQALIDAIENDNEVSQEALGSDTGLHLEYTLNWDRTFRVHRTYQQMDIPNHCNRKQHRVRTIGRCRVQDQKSKDGRCGFSSLKALGYKTDIKPKDQGGLSINQMIELCEKYNFPVRIINTQGHEFYQHKDHSDPSKTLVANIEEQHWYIFICFVQTIEEQRAQAKLEREQEKLKKKQEKEQKKLDKLKNKKVDFRKQLLVFWDCETVFNKDNENLAQTFSLAYFPIELKKNMPEIKKENIDWFANKVKIEWGEQCCAQMVNNLTKKYSTSKYYYKFISFNGSCFDDYFLIDQAIQFEERIVNCIFSNKSIIGLELEYGKCWDLRKFLTQGSLKELGENFKIYPQKIQGFDHRLPQKAFDQGKLDQWIRDNKSKIEEYNKFDVLALYSLTMAFRDSVIKLFQDEDGNIEPVYDPFNHNTIGSQSFAICKANWKKLDIKMPRPKSEEIDKYIRKCLTAGRTQVMASKNGKSVYINGRRFQMVDVVSLYPFVMLLADNFYPCGEQTFVKERDRTKLGFYRINVQNRADLPNVLPLRDYNKKNPLNWFCKDKFETWCCSIDLDVLEQHGHWFEVLDGYEFSDKISGEVLFSSLIKFRDEKLRQDVYKDFDEEKREILFNPAMRQVTKLFLNSLSGKVIQRNFTNMTQIVKSKFDFNKFVNKCQNNTVSCTVANDKFCVMNGEKENCYSTSAKPSYLGVYIYAHARKFMYNEIYTKIETHYTDTDSALVYYEDFLKFKEANPILFRKEKIDIDGELYDIKPFGTLDCEMKTFNDKKEWIGADEAYLMQAKNYLVCNKKEQYFPKIKCKGVSFNGSYCKEHEKQQGIIQCEKCDQGFCRYKSDNVPLYQDKTRLFEELLQKQICEVTCDQLLVRTFTNYRNSTVGIQFRTIHKKIKIDSISSL